MAENNFELNISEAAINRIKEVVKNKPDGYFLRVEVIPGGCQGFNSKFSLDNVKGAEDITFTKSGVNFVSDTSSLSIIDGSTIEFSSSLMGAFFWLNVKTAKASCSCGSSFSI